MGTPTALVIGAGIAGPALALFLRRAGYEVALHEARPADGAATGSYFTLAAEGRAVLARLGLADEADRTGSPTRRMEFLDHGGRVLGANTAPTTLLRRDRLSDLLRRAAARSGIQVVHGSRLVAIEPQQGATDGGPLSGRPFPRPVARFADGSRTGADLVVGCDGIHSAVRAALLPAGPGPRFTGVVDGGGIARLSEPPPRDGTMRLTFGRRAFFAWQTLPDGDVAWFQKTRVTTPDDVPPALWRERLLALHAGDHPLLTALIAATAGPVHRWPVHELPPLPYWSRGAVGLIGDAAHATGPHDGQGASMALEDALVLSRCLAGGAAPAQALRRYEALRRPRVEELVQRSNRTGRQKFPSSERAREVRDQLLPQLLRRTVGSSPTGGHAR
ncbi:FAD-dependent oxidoreductase [Streptomyces avidinii]